MYSSVDGAKSCANEIHRLFSDCNLDVPLAHCQEAVAHAGGFKDWHGLRSELPNRPPMPRNYDYWGKLIGALPRPCHYPLMAHVRDINEKPKVYSVEDPKWLRYIIPFAMALEGFHRTKTPCLRPGAGKGQRLRLAIVSGLLTNVEDAEAYSLRLDPKTLAVSIPSAVRDLLPKLAQHRDFAEAIDTLVAAGILALGPNRTTILAPASDEQVKPILAKAGGWRLLSEIEFDFIPYDRKLAAAVQYQYDLDRDAAGPKVPYGSLDYLGVKLSSRYKVEPEFSELKQIVDVMDDDIRGSIESIWYDSLAGSTYTVELKPEAFGRGLSYLIKDLFLTVCHGFNGLYVNQGAESWSFDPEWPGEPI